MIQHRNMTLFRKLINLSGCTKIKRESENSEILDNENEIFQEKWWSSWGLFALRIIIIPYVMNIFIFEYKLSKLYQSGQLLRGHLNWKNPLNSASGWNFKDPSPSSNKGPIDKNVSILYPRVIVKFSFFSKSQPHPLSYFTRKLNLTNFDTPDTMMLALCSSHPRYFIKG